MGICGTFGASGIFIAGRVGSNFAVADVVALNARYALARFSGKGVLCTFPDYAYRLFFVVVSFVTLLSMVARAVFAHYSKPSIRQAFSGLMISFSGLSALTYFQRHAFGRGVLLLTIGIGIITDIALPHR